MAVALVIGLGTEPLRERIANDRVTVARLTDVAALVSQIDAWKWQDVALGGPTETHASDIQAAESRMHADLAALSGPAGADAASIGSALSAYESDVSRELTLTAAGQPAAARAVDAQRADPDATRLRGAVDAAITLQTAAATRADWWMDVGTVGAFVLGAVVVGLLWTVFGRSRQIAAIALAEQGAIALNEQRYRSLVDHNPDAVYSIDPSGRVLSANPVCVTLTGQPMEELVGRSALEFVAPQHRVRALLNFRRALSGTPQHFESGLCRSDRRCLDVAITSIPITVDGAIVGVYNVAQDISARNATQQELRRREQEIRALVENSPDVVLRVDSAGRILYANPAFAGATGIAAATVVGLPFVEAGLPHGFAEDASAVLREVVQSGQESVVNLDFAGPDGLIRHYQTRLVPEPAADGTVESVLAVSRDLTDHVRAAEALAEREARLRMLLAQVPAALWTTDRDLVVTSVTGAGLGVLYHRPEELVGRRLPADLHGSLLDAHHAAVTQARSVQQPVTLRGAALQVVVEPLRGADGAVIGAIGMALDVTEHEQAWRLRQQLAAIVEASDDAIFSQTLDGTITSWNAGAQRVYGYLAEEIVGRSVAVLSPPDRTDELTDILRRLAAGEHIIQMETARITRDGRQIDVSLTISPVRDETGRVVGASTVARDISARKGLEAALVHQAFHDSLTGLANRALFLDRLEHALVRGSRHDRRVAILFVDLDNFKVINDSLGHEAGDQLLEQVGERLERSLRSGDTAARLGGDEFTVLLEDLPEPAEARQIAERVLEAIRAPLRIGRHELVVTASIGLATNASRASSGDDLLRHADMAMYQAKRQGKSRVEVYDPRMEGRAQTRLLLEQDLRRALKRRELCLAFQPVLDLHTGRIHGVEALLRWRHPERGLIMPADFVPIAEETGLILPIGRWVLAEACRQLQAWRAAMPDAPLRRVGVNLSPRQIQDPDLVAAVAAALDASRLEASGLALEITESAMMDDAHLPVLQSLKSLGVQLGIDDFGTGYSSLGYLKRLPLDFVKIDRTFVDGLGTDASDTVIVSGIIRLAHGLGLRVIAEGVEAPDHLDQLRELGCELAQGYWVARPTSADDVAMLLRGVLPADPLRAVG
ncbi:MAG TPA: EAL domain-containing protein [Thermomicrobiaceae bacterium]|nr:EAL domain-containing protein [Thermomicrobiaceae bacterium]